MKSMGSPLHAAWGMNQASRSANRCSSRAAVGSIPSSGVSGRSPVGLSKARPAALTSPRGPTSCSEAPGTTSTRLTNSEPSSVEGMRLPNLPNSTTQWRSLNSQLGDRPMQGGTTCTPVQGQGEGGLP